MNSKKRFSNRVDNYIKYRPGYPQEAIEFIFELTGFNANSIIADIGSGTGILTKYFDKRVQKIYAVEPNDEMRNAAEKLLEHQKNFISVNGSAEQTNLENNLLDGVIAAQSFHWFDKNKTKKEFKRILKNQGYIILLWNNHLTNTPFLTEYEGLLKNYANDYKEVDHRNLLKDDFDLFFSQYEKRVFEHKQVFDFKGMMGRVMSASYCPLPGEDNYSILFDGLKKAFDRYSINNSIDFNYEADVYVGRI